MEIIDIQTRTGYEKLNECPQDGQKKPRCEICAVLNCARGLSLMTERKKKGCNTCGVDRTKDECREIPCIGCPYWTEA